MTFYHDAPTYASPRKTGDIHFELFSRTSPVTTPFPRPPELRSVLSEEEWQERTVQLWTHFQKWSWSQLEKMGLMIAFALSLIVPITASIVVDHYEFNGLQPLPSDASVEDIEARLVKIRTAHAISGGITLGFLIFLWTPYLVIKYIGTRRLRNLLETYDKQDALKGTMQSLHWTLVRASTFQRSATVCVSLPVAFVQAHQPSSFSPGAYLPPYLAKEPSVASGRPADVPTAPAARHVYEGEGMKTGMVAGVDDRA